MYCIRWCWIFSEFYFIQIRVYISYWFKYYKKHKIRFGKTKKNIFLFCVLKVSPGLSFFYFLYIFLYEAISLILSLSSLQIAAGHLLLSCVSVSLFYTHLKRVFWGDFFSKKTVDNKQNKQQFHNNLQSKKKQTR